MRTHIAPAAVIGPRANDRGGSLCIRAPTPAREPRATPEDDSFNPEVSGFNLAVVHRPDLAVAVHTAEDIAPAVRFSAAHGLDLMTFNPGHGQLQPIDSGLLLNLSRLDTVTVDPATGTAVVGAGATWADVLAGRHRSD